MSRTDKLMIIFSAADFEGRAILTHDEFAYNAERAELTSRDIATLLASGKLRKGITGYWLRETPDPGAMIVFRNALAETETRDAAE